MTTVNAKSIDIAEVSEASSGATHIFTSDGSYEASIEDLLELLEDEEDIREGLKALAHDKGTVTWEQYQRKRTK
jgi:hypothetical protein